MGLTSDMLSRVLKRYLLNLESCICFIIFIILYHIINTQPVLFFFGRIKLKFGPKFKEFEKFDVTTANSVPFSKETILWEKQFDNAAVYAIRGRRDSMEDRFDYMTEKGGASLYGVFDGHGGQVRPPFLIICALKIYEV